MKSISFIMVAVLLAVITFCFAGCDSGVGEVLTIEITTMPQKQVYKSGENLDLTGLTVSVISSDGSKNIVENYIAFPPNGSVMNKIGAITIEISYSEGGASATGSFNVVIPGMKLISSGQFTMGNADPSIAPAACIAPHPQRTVKLTKDFYIGVFEVTQAEYLDVTGTNPSLFKTENGRNPVEQVSWYDAVEFCNALSIKEGFTPAYNIDKNNSDPNNTLEDDTDPKWTVTIIPGANGYRLPTEAEWEYACRAGTTTVFNVGSTINTNQANYNGAPYLFGELHGLYRGKPIEAGSFAPNPWGLYDMHGNVWEWCWDFVNYEGANYYTDAPNPDTDPTGLTKGNRRVERGGSWDHPPARAISAYRERARPQRKLEDLGFRVVRPVNN